MNIIRLCSFLTVAFSSQAWSETLKHYDGMVGSRPAEVSLAWGEDGSVKGSYFCPSGKQVQYRLVGVNKVEGELELNEYTGDILTANISLKKRAAMIAKEKWTRIMAVKNVESAIVVERLRSSEKLIGPNSEEYTKYIELAQKAEKENRFLQAAEYYRNAYKIDRQQVILEKTQKCEGQASGL